MKKLSWHELKPQVKEVWVLSLPAILTQITTIVMQYIDSAMVGSLGANASAAIGLVSTSTWLLGGITYAVSAGFSVQVAHNIGAGTRCGSEKRGASRPVHGAVRGRDFVRVGAFHPQYAADVARRRPGYSLRCLEILHGVRVDDPVLADQLAELVVLAVQRRYADAEHFKRRHVFTRCGVQYHFHSAFRRDGCGHRHGECVCGYQPDDGVALPVVQPAFAAQPQRDRKARL